jgi:hypothetical protein
MGNKTFWIGFIAVYIVWQIIGFLVHGMMLADTYANMWQVFRPQAEMDGLMWMMFLSSALYLLLFCYIFTKGYEGKGVGEGVRYGLLMGLFMAIPMSIDPYVVYPLTPNLVGAWFVALVVSFVVAGAVFASIYKPNAGAARLAAAT